MGCNSVYNFLKPNGFVLEIEQLPKSSYTCQSAGIPEIFLGTTIQPTPFLDLNGPGDKIQFSDLSVVFLISEDMENYQELYNWMIGIGFPANYQQYSNISNERRQNFPYPQMDHNLPLFSDGRLLVLDSNNNIIRTFIFKEMLPKSLSIPKFDTTVQDIQYMVGTIVFSHNGFTVE